MFVVLEAEDKVTNVTDLGLVKAKPTSNSPGFCGTAGDLDCLIQRLHNQLCAFYCRNLIDHIILPFLVLKYSRITGTFIYC